MQNKENKSEVTLTVEDQAATSRQVATFGLEACLKLKGMKVLMYGARGLGFEVSKNLVLAGPGELVVYDPNPVEFRDLGSNFFFMEADVGKNRAEVLVAKLKQLNDRCNVRVSDVQDPALQAQNEAASAKGGYSVVCYTENFVGVNKLIEDNEYARNPDRNIGFILSEALGLASYCFVDYGVHKVTDYNAKPYDTYIVRSIIVNKENGSVKVTLQTDPTLGGNGPCTFVQGDYVVFSEIEGMTALNNAKPIRIKNKRAFEFILDMQQGSDKPFDGRELGRYLQNGKVTGVKAAYELSFKSLKYCLEEDPRKYNLREWYIAGYRENGLKQFNNGVGSTKVDQLHLATCALLEFQQKNGRYPKDQADEDAAMEIALKKALSLGNFDNLDMQSLGNFFRFSSRHVTNICTLFGGIVAQEIIKRTGIYIPLQQWLHYECFSTIPSGTLDREMKDKTLRRYEDQIAIYGNAYQQKLMNTNTFVIGAGALGCEFLKACALMGLGCGKDGVIVLTDNDEVSVSNLNRQFLFGEKSVDQPKSSEAANRCRAQNKAINIKDMKELVYGGTEHIFDEKFWCSQDFIIIAVDNDKARRYIDAKCNWFNKIIIESGTLGIQSTNTSIIPGQTQTYNETPIPDTTTNIAMCTLKSFPYLIDHCIEWSRDQFFTIFEQEAEDANNFCKNPDFFYNSMKQNNAKALESTFKAIDKLTAIKESGSFQSCVQLARDMYDTYFIYRIRDLQEDKPENYEDPVTHEKYWKGSKRYPSQMPFDMDNKDCSEFIYSTANLFAFNCMIKGMDRDKEEDRAAVKQMGNNTKPVEYKKHAVDEGEEKEELTGDDLALMEEITENQFLASKARQAKFKVSAKNQVQFNGEEAFFEAVDFEKDIDQNYHIDFIHYASEGRAFNYKLKDEAHSREKSKVIAGKILAAVLTTTASVTGLVGAEISRAIQGIKSKNAYKSGMMNLASNDYEVMTPLLPRVYKDHTDSVGYEYAVIPRPPKPYNTSTKIDYDGKGKTLQDLIDWLKNTHKVMPVTDQRHWMIGGFKFEEHWICHANDFGTTSPENIAAYQAALQPLLGMTFEEIYRKVVLKQKENDETVKAKKEGRNPAFDAAAVNNDLDKLLKGKNTMRIDFDGCYDPDNYDQDQKLTHCAPIKCTFK